MSMLPAALHTEGGVETMGWLRVNGKQRWVKVGTQSLQFWSSEQAESYAQEVLFSRDRVRSLMTEAVARDEPVACVTLATATPPREFSYVLEAYTKESEPTKDDRIAHLNTFVEVLRQRCVEHGGTVCKGTVDTAEVDATKAAERAYRANLTRAFTIFDTDGDGKLSPSEVVAVLTRLTPDLDQAFSEVEAQEFINDFDEDEDGALSIAEFVEAVRASRLLNLVARPSPRTHVR